jgi:predicted DNA binding CopG/RHH family protein
MKYYALTQDEEALLVDFEHGKLRRARTGSKANYQAYATATLNRTRHINIRLSDRDLQKLKSRAAEKGIPYQTHVASILHEFGTK